MSFTDFLFLPFIVLDLVLYFILPLKSRWVSLLVFSIVFFCTWGVDYLPIILLITLVAWISGRIIDSGFQTKRAEKDGQDNPARGTGARTEKRAATRRKRQNKAILVVSSVFMILILVYVKVQQELVQGYMEPVVHALSGLHQSFQELLAGIPYIGDLVSSGENWGTVLFQWIFGPAESGVVPAVQQAADMATVTVSTVEQVSESPSLFYTWIVPLGISYYTLSLIGYLADIYWKKGRAERNYFKLLLFVLYFPKILEGPISKHRVIGPQLTEGHQFDYKRVCFGLQRMVWGFFKKLVIADHLSVLVNEVFGNYQIHLGSEFLVAAVLGAVQLYCDFSGCMDIALGVSECFGITLEENFRQPFASRSAAEFWRRWHISLGVWFKDYIFMPMVISPRLMKISGFFRKKAGKRAGNTILTVIPLAAVWILTGLWHGIGGNYLFWGAYWGLLIILSTVFEPEIQKLTKLLNIDTASGGFRFFQKSRTFWLFVISRIITIPNTLEVSRHVFHSIFTSFAPWKLVDGSLFTLGIDRPQFAVTALAIALVGYVGSKREKGIYIREWIAARPLPIRWIIYYAAIFAVLVFGAYGPGYNAASFVYMKY